MAPSPPAPRAPLSDRDWLVALHASPGLGHAAACRVAALGVAAARELARRPGALREAGIPAAAAHCVEQLEVEGRGRVDDAVRRSELANARLVTLADAEAPAALAQLELPPPLLYVRGRLPDAPAVAVVGARRASAYGLEVAGWIARELAAAGVTVVSGFAVGVDAAAHRAALAVEGSTVAVLGCGVDIDYPRGHRPLGDAITGRGAVVSEFPPGCGPLAHQFPVRNRLIAALAGVCVVVEAAPRSGSLVTARLALELGREVLAVPGRVSDELALGTNALIADGARPLLDPRDALEALGVAGGERPPRERREPPGVGGRALALWRACAEAGGDAGTLAARAGVEVEHALGALLTLELAGHLRRGVDGAYEVPR